MATRKEVKKQQKAKRRAIEKKKKIMKKRETLRAVAREQKEEYRMDKKIKKLQKSMADFEYWPEEFLSTLPEQTIDKLQHNAEILRDLEKRYEQETAQKREVNESLEEQGLVTPEEKLRALMSAQQEKNVGVGGASDCSMKPNESLSLQESSEKNVGVGGASDCSMKPNESLPLQESSDDS